MSLETGNKPSAEDLLRARWRRRVNALGKIAGSAGTTGEFIRMAGKANAIRLARARTELDRIKSPNTNHS